jgi:hypothetical protein
LNTERIFTLTGQASRPIAVETSKGFGCAHIDTKTMTDTSNPLHLHPDFGYEVVHVGNERLPVIVIDNFLREATRLVDFAATRSEFRPLAGTLYPGIRAPMPLAYGLAIDEYLREAICAVFGLDEARIVSNHCDFALVTTPPDELLPIQRCPHFDGTDLSFIAGVHYLCAPGHGGTSFYRHRSTGFESIGEAQQDIFAATLKNEFAVSSAPPPRYANGDSNLFVRTASFDAVFNRLLLYRGVMLHSGNIAPEFEFDNNPRTGRLTANSFLQFR